MTNRYKSIEIQRKVEFKLNPFDRGVRDPEQWLKDGLRDIYDHCVEPLSPSDKMGITFSADDFDGDFHTSFLQV